MEIQSTFQNTVPAKETKQNGEEIESEGKKVEKSRRAKLSKTDKTKKEAKVKIL